MLQKVAGALGHKGFIIHILPFMEWIGSVRLSTLKTDAIAGVTVALVLIPQMAAPP